VRLLGEFNITHATFRLTQHRSGPQCIGSLAWYNFLEIHTPESVSSNDELTMGCFQINPNYKMDL